MDNSDINQKIKIRKKGLALMPNPKTIVDMYAGEGHISRNLWSLLKCDLTCIEKEPYKLDKIDFDCTKICGNNVDYIDLAAKADIIDMDAYGMVMKNLKSVLELSSKTQIIFFTESIPYTKDMQRTINEIINLDVTCFWIEKCKKSSVFYGYVYKKVL